MKKRLLSVMALATAFAAVAFVGCDENGENGQDGQDGKSAQGV